MEERQGVTTPADPEGKRSPLQQRLQEETAAFDFATLLQGGTLPQPPQPAAGSHLPGNAARPFASPSVPNSVPARRARLGVGIAASVAVSALMFLIGTRWHNAHSFSGASRPYAAPTMERTSLPKASALSAEEPSAARTDTGSAKNLASAASSANDTSPRKGPTAGASVSTGTMPLRLAHTLVGPFSYWFVAASQQASAPQALAAPDARGRVDMIIPAAYNHVGAQVRLLDQSLGKVARFPVQDFSRPQAIQEPQVGPDVLRPATSGPGTQAWVLEQSETARGTLQIREGLEGPVGVAGPVLHLEVTALAAQNWHVQCYQTGVDLQEARPYQLAFWARAERARPMDVNVLLDKPDWHILGLTAHVGLTPQWQKYTLPFTARHCVPGHARVAFLLGNALGTVEMAAVSLRRGSGSAVSRPLDPTGAVGVALKDFH